MTSPLFTPRILLSLLLLMAILSPLAAQDTRGSLVPDAVVLLADGTTREVQDLRQGTMLWTWLPGGKPGPAKVTALRKQHSDSYIQLKAGKLQVHATGAHRIALPGGALVRLDTLKVGDKILSWGLQGLEETVVTSVRVFPATLVTYDLTVEGHRLFQVGGILLAD